VRAGRGRHYVAASALVEVHPLHRLTPNVFVNLSDGSALVQLNDAVAVDPV
jgi:hypothetical protein